MHSSTSNSESRVPTVEQPSGRSIRRAIVLLLVALSVILVAAEFAARVVFPRVSHIERRITEDRTNAEAIQSNDAEAPSTVLLVGNSLLLHALDYPRSVAALSPDVKPVRFVIENTNYLDWYFGLNRLFSEGVKPARVGLCLNLGQMLDPRILGDYSARHLFRASDILSASREAKLDNTETSGLFFAHWSEFYADRATIRNYILNVSDPGYSRVMNALARVPPNFPPDEIAIQESRERLRAVTKLCQDHNVKFVLIIAPSLKRFDDLLVKAAELENIAVVTPVPLGSLGPEFFLDRLHLNEKGATLFTDALVKYLRKGSATSQ